jgi:hypothetical protein
VNAFGNGGLAIDLAVRASPPNDDDTVSQPANYANRGLELPGL